MDEISLDQEVSGSSTDDCDDWATELRRKVGKTTCNKKRREMQCIWGDHCSMASDCPYLHTEEERKLFARFPRIRFSSLKTVECNNKDQHVTADQRKWCAFAHDDQDSWCLACKMYGHLTDNCQLRNECTF